MNSRGGYVNTEKLSIIYLDLIRKFRVKQFTAIALILFCKLITTYSIIWLFCIGIFLN